MKRLTILTERYEKILHTYLNGGGDNEWIVRSETRAGKFFTARVSYSPGGKFTETLTALLEEAAALENPVYRYSPRLMEIARDLRGTPVNKEDEQRLAEFLSRNASLHIEGYAAFRMADYGYRLDLMSYSLIKKMQMTKR